MTSNKRGPRRNLLLGQIAVRTGQMLPKELEEALSIQETLQEVGISVQLGKICTDKGYLSGNGLSHLLAVQRAGVATRRDHFFGNIALANGFLDRPSLKRALLLQRRYQQRRDRPAPRIGAILTSKELLEPQQVQAVLAAQRRLRHDADAGLPRSARLRQLNWYVADDDGPRGPLTDRQLTAAVREGLVTAPDLLWREGFEDWVLAGSLEDFEERARLAGQGAEGRR